MFAYIPFIIVLIISSAFEFFKGGKWLRCLTISASLLILSSSFVWIDYLVKTTDTEVWSGSVVGWDHTEEYDEWHPEVCTTTTDDKGRTSTSCTPGYWEHHYATNYIKTTDEGWISVKQSPDGKTRFSDSWPNTDSELQQMWPEGTPSASVHTYKNKVKSSYSIYRVEDIDEKDYPDLPKYPKTVESYININRIVGDVPNKDAALKLLAQKNTELNKFIPDPERPGKKRSWKQVNMIFVNVGADKSEDYGYALQNLWKNGNKNDFVVSFSMNNDGKLNWVHAFSWSEVEILKMEVRDELMTIGTITDFVPIVNKVSDMVAEKFERKEFADFAYIKIEPSLWVYIIIWILAFIAIISQITHYVMTDYERYYRR